MPQGEGHSLGPGILTSSFISFPGVSPRAPPCEPSSASRLVCLPLPKHASCPHSASAYASLSPEMPALPVHWPNSCRPLKAQLHEFCKKTSQLIIVSPSSGNTALTISFPDGCTGKVCPKADHALKGSGFKLMSEMLLIIL